MNLGRLREIYHVRLKAFWPDNELVQGVAQGFLNAEFIFRLGEFLSLPWYVNASNDEDVKWRVFSGYCSVNGCVDMDSRLRQLSTSDLCRRVFDSWALDYRNHETSILSVDVLDIEPSDLIVLDNIAYDVDELLLCYQQFPAPAWFRSPETNDIYSMAALDAMSSCPRLQDYAAALKEYYLSCKYDNDAVFDQLHDLLNFYLEIGSKDNGQKFSFSKEDLEACAVKRYEFLQFIQTLPEVDQELFFNAIIFLTSVLHNWTKYALSFSGFQRWFVGSPCISY